METNKSKKYLIIHIVSLLVCLFPISAIIGIVVTLDANKDYNKDNFNGYKEKITFSKIMVLANILYLILAVIIFGLTAYMAWYFAENFRIGPYY